MMSLHTMLGKQQRLVFVALWHNVKANKRHHCTEWEYTRFRKRPKGGGRELRRLQDVYSFNAWDKVEWDEEQKLQASEAVVMNSSQKLSKEEGDKFQVDAEKFWDAFYSIHNNHFFKNRCWLFAEFPQLAPPCQTAATTDRVQTILELGCGVGDTILPILNHNQDCKLKVYGCDFSKKAIEILQAHPEFDNKRCRIFVMDITKEHWDVPFEENSLDIIILIFVLSAIEPSKMNFVARNCFRYLRPGGLVLFRDYGRYDLTQLRFKVGKCIQDNMYVRGDGTTVYYFTQQGLQKLFVSEGFEEEQSYVDRRLQVNRGRMLKMYRVWIQAQYKKP